MKNLLILFIQKIAKQKLKSDQDFLNWKRKLVAELKIAPPSNVEILNLYKNLRQKKQVNRNLYLEKELKKRPIRSLSGVAVISVLTKPWPCPGRCLYCPLEPGIPKSYLSGEPAVERAKLLKYDPYQQVKKRIEALERTGHPTDKIELIVIGGTWSYLPKNYQTWFIKKCFDGANATNNKKQITNNKLGKAQKINEKAQHRIIGITLETRPDYITSEEIVRMRKLGCTRIEIGVQAIDDRILKINQRGHDVQKIIQATKLLKEAGLKVCYHMMPGLPGSTPQKDFQMFKELFFNPDYQPDMLKIYPCVATKGSALYKLWRKKQYKPYSDKQLINLLVKIKSIIPPYVRIIRVVRDIPSPKIEGGSKISNLREVIQKEMRKRGLKCRCIRCREIRSSKLKFKSLKLIRKEYNASEGREIFLSFEDIKNDRLIAFLRLRLPLSTNCKSITNPEPELLARCGVSRQITNYFPELKEAAMIREVHTYGKLVPLGEKREAAQHIGFGKKLIKEAEKIAKKSGYKKIAVIAGIGVREYYRKLGYRLKNTYMIKSLEH